MDYDYDLIVIGSGPGGYTAAVTAAKLGLKTAIIEKSPFPGGTCLNVGCIPSKALLSSSEHYHYASHHFAKHGIQTGSLSMDVPTMMKRKDEVVLSLRQGINFLYKSNKVTSLVGLGTLRDAHTVEVRTDDGKSTSHSSRHILIATGSVPIVLPGLEPDGDRIVTSDEAIAFDSVPESLLVIGGGAIGLELGSVWARLGSKVDVVEFFPKIAGGFDDEISKSLQKLLEKQGLTFHLNTKVQSARPENDGVTVTAMRDGKESSFHAAKVLVAVGRKPFTEGLGLEQSGVRINERGRIAVDADWRTSVDSIFAVGDVTEGPMLAHKAEAEGVAFAERLAGHAGLVNADLIPNVVYTSPEVASVGLTTEQLIAKDIPFKTGKYLFMNNGRAKAVDQTDGFVKILSHRDTDRLLGAHILASNASELIAECVAVMEFSGSAEDLARTIHAHPTMAEVIKEAAHAVA